jgi:hypothetical protein
MLGLSVGLLFMLGLLAGMEQAAPGVLAASVEAAAHVHFALANDVLSRVREIPAEVS